MKRSGSSRLFAGFYLAVDCGVTPLLPLAQPLACHPHLVTRINSLLDILNIKLYFGYEIRAKKGGFQKEESHSKEWLLLM